MSDNRFLGYHIQPCEQRDGKNQAGPSPDRPDHRRQTNGHHPNLGRRAETEPSADRFGHVEDAGRSREGILQQSPEAKDAAGLPGRDQGDADNPNPG